MRFLALMALFSTVLLGADLTGTYQGEVETSSGKAKNVLVLKMKGTTLTGTLTNQFGKLPIEHGAVDGEEIFFNVTVDNDGEPFKMTYRGHVFAGNEIQFKIEAGERVIDLITKKQTTGETNP